MARQIHRVRPKGQLKIDKSRVRLRLSRDAKGKIDGFSILKLDLDGLKLPEDAKVSLEAYEKYQRQRYDLGLVKDNLIRDDLPFQTSDAAGLKFRLLIVPDGEYKLIASCEKLQADISSEESAKTIPLLPVDYDYDGPQLWKLRLEGDDRPVLMINGQAELGLRSKVESRDPELIGLIIPQAINQCLWALIRNPASDDDDTESWQNIWNQFLIRQGVTDCPDDPLNEDNYDITKAWCDEVTDIIATRKRFVDNLLMQRESENE